MLVLNKRRIIFITFCICLSVFLFFITEDAENTQSSYIETVSLPVSNRVVVLDAGHGIPDERCRE